MFGMRRIQNPVPKGVSVRFRPEAPIKQCRRIEKIVLNGWLVGSELQPLIIDARHP